ncbi:PaaI family thioesterase [Desulfobacterales bacterium HSG17]|nr:PaaI family thioesterase [Desulfobacterales bacterium HSG17]
MKTINPGWLKQIQNVVNPSPYFQLQQMYVKEVGWGISVLEIDLEERHLQPFGVVHGGVFASLIDAAGFWAVYSQVPQELGMTTVELSINYLAPAVSGKLIGTGQCIKLGKTLGVGQALIENENGQLLASGKTTVMVMKHNNPLEKDSNYVPKFLSE